ncbi:MAG: sterol desaturase family protein [Rhizobiales bacterium]|nr:sterol desaturase family protein [Hyphomicrobiales bacterium]
MTWITIERVFLALLPDRQTLWLLGYAAVIAFFAWVESRKPAFAEPPVRAQRWPANLGIGLMNLIIVILAPVSAVLAAQWAHGRGYGLLNVLEAPWWLAAVATVLLRSFAGYLFHLLMHKVPLFWRVHRVHHSDTHLDVSTALRSHPLEFVGLILIVVPLAAASGMNPIVLAAYELAEAGLNVATHANLRLPERLDRTLRWVFVTPNMHSLHHSSDHRETDSNYGTVFSVWDRIFRTYSAAPRSGYDAMQIGLKEIRDRRVWDFVWLLKSPALKKWRQRD